MEENVTMTCMTTKKRFEVLNPPVVVLKNGRYAYRVACPWLGKNDKELFAFKFCSAAAYKRYCDMQSDVPTVDNTDDTSNESGAEVAATE